MDQMRSALSTQDLTALTNELATVTRWYVLGIQLGVPPHVLRTIEQNHPQDAERCKSEMLVKWLQLGRSCSWKAVVDALRQMGVGALANQIQRQYVTPFVGMSLEDTIEATRRNDAVMRINFTDLLDFTAEKLQQKLEKKEFSINRFHLTLAGMFAPAKCIPKSSDMDEIFLAITENQLWDYLNYYQLETIIKKYSKDDKEMTQKITNYKQDLAGFKATTKIIRWIEMHSEELQDDSDSEVATPPANQKWLARYDPNYFRKLEMKLRGKFTDRTLEYVDHIWKSLSINCFLPPLTVLLDKIHHGCISISWLVQLHVIPQLIDMGQECTEFFREHEIIRVIVDDECIYEEESITEGETPTMAVKNAKPIELSAAQKEVDVEANESLQQLLVESELRAQEQESQKLPGMQKEVEAKESENEQLIQSIEDVKSQEQSLTDLLEGERKKLKLLQEELSTTQKELSAVEKEQTIQKTASESLLEQLVESEWRAQEAERESQQAKQESQKTNELLQAVQKERDELTAAVELRDKQLDWERKGPQSLKEQREDEEVKKAFPEEPQTPEIEEEPKSHCLPQPEVSPDKQGMEIEQEIQLTAQHAQAQIQELSARLDQMEAQLHHVTDEKEMFQLRVKQLQDQLQQENKHYQMTVKQLQDQLQAEKEEKEYCRQTVKQLQDQLQAEKEEKEYCRQTVKQLQDQLQAEKEEKEYCRQTVKQLRDQLQAEKEEKEYCRQTVKQLQDQLRQENKHYQMTVKQLQDQLQAEKEEKEYCRLTVKQLQDQLQAEKEEKEYCRQTVKQLQDQLQAEKEEKEYCRQTVKQLQDQLRQENKHYQMTVKQLQDQLQTEKEEKEYCRQTVKQLQDQLQKKGRVHSPVSGQRSSQKPLYSPASPDEDSKSVCSSLDGNVYSEEGGVMGGGVEEEVQFQLLKYIDQLGDKNSRTRMAALEYINEVLCQKIVTHHLLGYKETVIDTIVRGLKKVHGGERCALLRLAELLAVQFGDGHPELLTSLKPLLLQLALDPSVSQPEKAACVSVLGTCTFIQAPDVLEVESVMHEIEKLFQSKQEAVLVAAVKSWSLLLSIAPNSAIPPLVLSLLPLLNGLLNGLLDKMDMNIRIAVGQALALLFELAREVDDELVSTADGDETYDIIQQLATESNRYMARKDCSQQRAHFRDILQTLEDGTVPERDVKFGIEVLSLDSWAKLIQYGSFKDLLGGGLKAHLKGNDLLREVFQLGPPPLDTKESKASRLERKYYSAARAKHRTQSRSKQRDKRAVL